MLSFLVFLQICLNFILIYTVYIKMDQLCNFENHQFGYPTDIFEEEPDEEFTCGICSFILNDPHQCPRSHTYCRDCFKSHLRRSSTCPTCREKMSVETLHKSLIVGKLIDKLRIHCPLSTGQDRCTWSGTLGQKNKHFEEDCKLTLTSCRWSEQGCPCLIRRKDLPQHEYQCEFQEKLCPYCNFVTTVAEMDKHKSDCFYRPVKCEKCAMAVTFCDYDQHLDNDCAQQEVPCLCYQYYGFCTDCSGTVLRGRAYEHAPEASYRLLQALMTKSVSDDETIKGLREDVQRLVQTINGQPPHVFK